MQEIVNILSSFLGTVQGHDASEGQIKFNCPNCDRGRNKGNLEVNYRKNIYSCWSCRDDDGGIRGYDIRWLIKKYGDDELFWDYQKLKPQNFAYTKKESLKVLLPKGYRGFSKANTKETYYKPALAYLKHRGIDFNIIRKHRIGFCREDKLKGRIIIPSYDRYGQLDYWVARDFLGNSKLKYLNHPNPKEEVVFNEFQINWDASVFLVEGVFDHIVLYNSIPMLGKHPSNKLINCLQQKLQGNLYIALDGDAQNAAYKLANKLNYGRLSNRIFIVTFEGNEDVSFLYEKTNYKNFYKSIRERLVAV